MNNAVNVIAFECKTICSSAELYKQVDLFVDNVVNVIAFKCIIVCSILSVSSFFLWSEYLWNAKFHPCFFYFLVGSKVLHR